MQSVFDRAYDRLNPEQKQAVDTLYGPVSVIAGPGTGKTQLLTLRIANLIDKIPGIQARNILALTFTEAGVVAMRDRLRSFIGSDAYQVHIATFHGFCNDMIQSYPEKFQFAAQLKPLDDLSKNKMIGKIFLEGKWTHLYNRYDPEMYLGDTISHVSTLKREWVDPSDLRVRVKKAIEGLDNREDLHYQKKWRDKQPGDRKATFVREENKLLKQLEWCDVYEKYEATLKQEWWYDYDDMIRMVVDRMQSDQDFLLSLQEQYQFIMIDEYQDTNNLQNTIAMKLVSGLDQPNILVVGDDEQSIYRFQGAVMENIVQFHNTFEKFNLQTLVLSRNYRSNQGILDASRQVVQNNQYSLQNELSLDKRLIASHPDFQDQADVQIQRFVASDERIETDFLVSEIKKLHDQWVEYKDIAIIYRKHANAIDIMESFVREGIPYRKQSGERLLDHPEAQKLLKTLKLIGNIENSELLWEVLLYDFWELDLAHLLRVQSENSGRGDKRWDRKLYEALLRTDDMKIQIIVGKICGFHKQSANTTLTGFFELFLESSGYRDFILAQEDKLERLSILDSFFTEMKEFNVSRPDAGIGDFVQYLDECLRYNVPLSTAPLRFSADAVNLMTAHGSKGLEFEKVFLYKTTAKNWEKSRSPHKLALSVDIFDRDSLLAEEGLGEIALEEQRRIFFVCMTRAKSGLYILGTQDPTKKQDPSQFVYEIPDQHIQELEYIPDPEVILTRSTAPVIPIDWSEATEAEIRQRISRYVLSPTALNNWLHSPALFLERNLIKKPAAKSVTMSVGTAIHKVLEELTKYGKEHKTLMPDDQWQEVLKTALDREILTSHEKEVELEKGIQVVRDYIESEGHGLDEFALTEFRIPGSRPVVIESVPCSGAIDRVEFLDNHEVRVIDYKTGSVKKFNTPLGADYERQLYFYKLLWDGLGKSEVLSQGSLDFVMHPKEGSVVRNTVTYESEKLEELRGYIRVFHDAMNAEKLEFPEIGILDQNDHD